MNLATDARIVDALFAPYNFYIFRISTYCLYCEYRKDQIDICLVCDKYSIVNSCFRKCQA